jgi:hypothetical protein
MTAILISGLLFAMTVRKGTHPPHQELSDVLQGHAQDFRDRLGDAAIRRKTIPMTVPQSVVRWSLLLLTTYYSGTHPCLLRLSLHFSVVIAQSSLRGIACS